MVISCTNIGDSLYVCYATAPPDMYFKSTIRTKTLQQAVLQTILISELVQIKCHRLNNSNL